MDGFAAVVALASLFGGAVASVAGFGIGSVLTPVLATQAGTKLAVAAVALPHFAGTALRFWMMRRHLDRGVLLGFGIASAAGGLTGALLHRFASSTALGLVFGALLVFVGIGEWTGLTRRLRFRGAAAWLAGGASGVLGGLVGNQGGIRSGALLGFPLSRDAFIATSTAAGLIVDLARLPVYIWTEGQPLWAMRGTVALATLGVVAGTLAGRRLLARLPEAVFRRLVGTLILLLGLYMLGRSALEAAAA